MHLKAMKLNNIINFLDNKRLNTSNIYTQIGKVRFDNHKNTKEILTCKQLPNLVTPCDSQAHNVGPNEFNINLSWGYCNISYCMDLIW